MSKISLIAKLTAAEGKAGELDTALREVVVAAEEEEGLEIYSVHADKADSNVFYFFELYRDQDALDVHGRGDRMKPAMKALGSMLAGRPEVTMLDPVVAKGLDL
ncbi:MAG: putative quinol monooxygenase [Acidimicrobiales bacterium]